MTEVSKPMALAKLETIAGGTLLHDLVGQSSIAKAAAQAQTASKMIAGFGALSLVDRAAEAARNIDLITKVSGFNTLQDMLREQDKRALMVSQILRIGQDLDFAKEKVAVGLFGVPQDHLTGALSLSALMRHSRWANNLSVHAEAATSLLSTLRATEAVKLATSANLITEATRGLDLGRLGLLSPLGHDMDRTTLKLSAFAGMIETIRSQKAIENSVATLFGTWRSHDGLPSDYWRSRAVRAEHYARAEVDSGLISAPNAVVVEALVESGVVEGRRTERGQVVAAFEVGDVRVRIAADRAPSAGFAAIRAFEIALRAFLAAQLEPIHGPEWFARTAQGDAVGQAKRRRHAALVAGEDKQPLVDYSELGDLIHVVTSKSGWPIFEPFFGRMDMWKVDLDRLIALRRPTAHARKTDGVQLAEMLLTIRRRMADMGRTEARAAGWDDDA